MSETMASPAHALHGMLRPLARSGLVAALIFLGAFGAWSWLAPLSSAAIAPGVVNPDSGRKTVQHLEGGIIQEILVKEGDQVTAGDILIRLSPVQANANFSAREHQWRRLMAERLRLEALAAGWEILTWPDRLALADDTELKAFLANQEAMFALQRQGLSEKQTILDRRADQIRAEIDATMRENAGLKEQISIVDEDIADKEALRASGLLRKPDLLLLKRQRAELAARMAANEADIARADQRIEEVAIAKLASETEFRDMLAGELARIGAQIAPLEEALAASEDVLRRTEIVAPVSGTVINLRTHMSGGIVRAAEPILDLVPSLDAFIIEARLAPNDIDDVYIGQPARVHLTPYAARNMPPLEGRLVHIDPDSTTDETTRERYYKARLVIDPASLEAHAVDIKLLHGMPAEVFITTGEQSLMSYLSAPLVQSFRRAFREN